MFVEKIPYNMIGDRAFGYCFNLTSLTLPESVVYTDEDAFEDCNCYGRFEHVIAPADPLLISQSSFSDRTDSIFTQVKNFIIALVH